MTRGKLIGLVGYKGSGKTTLTKAALLHLNNHEAFDGMPFIHHMGFSDPLIAMLRAMGISSEILDNKERWNEPLEILCGHTIRYACTTLGTEWGRDHIGQDVWTCIALKRADELRNTGRHVIIDNCRFPSEMDAMREADAIFVHVYRSGNMIDCFHESERHIEYLAMKCDYQLANNGEFDKSAEKWREMLLTILRE